VIVVSVIVEINCRIWCSIVAFKTLTVHKVV